MSSEAPDGLLASISYDPETGAFSWTVTNRYVVLGERADRVNARGYRRIPYKNKTYQAHRVAWRVMTGEWPAQLVDHANGDRADNRWSNLRAATPAQNNANMRGQGRYPKGVSFHKQVGRYQASIKVDGKCHYLGLHDTVEQAHAAYIEAAKLHFGEFARAA